jgi:hypothetical protein
MISHRTMLRPFFPSGSDCKRIICSLHLVIASHANFSGKRVSKSTPLQMKTRSACQVRLPDQVFPTLTAHFSPTVRRRCDS